MTSYVASLRVFVPLSTLPSGERRRWERYIAAGRAPDRVGLSEAERMAGLIAAVLPSLDVDEEHALVEVVDGVTYVCPARTQLRVWEAAGAFREGLPDLIADAFIPRALADAAADQLSGWREVSPDLHTHTKVATWVVPLAWFLLFDPKERVLESGTLRYVTPMSQARRRTARAIGVLRRTLAEAPTLPMLEELSRWLDGFHPYARVELDYGGLATLMGEALPSDDSVNDLTTGLDALARGDGAAASAAYQRVAERWNDLQLRETAS